MVEGEGFFDVFVFFNAMLFTKEARFFEARPAAAIAFKDASIVAREKSVFIGVPVVSFPGKIKTCGGFQESF